MLPGRPGLGEDGEQEGGGDVGAERPGHLVLEQGQPGQVGRVIGGCEGNDIRPSRGGVLA